jgi:acyl-CoA reductase-like NAD-dependent aldehyde dehydrogenase
MKMHDKRTEVTTVLPATLPELRLFIAGAWRESVTGDTFRLVNPATEEFFAEVSAVPWGGAETSGIGRELGLSGLHANTEEKVVSIVL